MTNKPRTTGYEYVSMLQKKLDEAENAHHTLQDILNAVLMANGGPIFVTHEHMLAATRKPVVIRHTSAGMWVEAEGGDYARLSPQERVRRLFRAPLVHKHNLPPEPAHLSPKASARREAMMQQEFAESQAALAPPPDGKLLVGLSPVQLGPDRRGWTIVLSCPHGSTQVTVDDDHKPGEVVVRTIAGHRLNLQNAKPRPITCLCVPQEWKVPS